MAERKRRVTRGRSKLSRVATVRSKTKSCRAGHATGAERLMAQPTDNVLPILRHAHHLLRANGWSPHEWRLPANERSGRLSLTEAIQTGTLAGWYARKLVCAGVGTHNLPGWEEHPLRTEREVREALFKAIELAGGKRPRPGGWKVTEVRE